MSIVTGGLSDGVFSYANPRYGVISAPDITDAKNQAVLVYISGLAPNVWHQLPTTVNATSVDFLYFNGSIWVVRANTSSTDPGAASYSYQYYVLQKSTVAALKASGVNLNDVNAVRRFLKTTR